MVGYWGFGQIVLEAAGEEVVLTMAIFIFLHSGLHRLFLFPMQKALAEHFLREKQWKIMIDKI